MVNKSKEKSIQDALRPSKTVYAVAGGVSGFVTRAVCQPMDVIKIRFQLQVEPISKNSSVSKYRSMTQATKLIIQEEGFAALWKGHVPAQVLSVLYGVVQFGVYESLKEQADHIKPGTAKSPTTNFLSGAVSGCTATVISFPFDVVRTRLIAQGNERLYTGMTHGFIYICQKESPYALFKGLSPTLLQIAPMAGAQFAFFTFFKQIFTQVSWLGEEKTEGQKEGKLYISGGLLAGSLAGLCSKSLLYPFDLARKRLQIQGFLSARKGYGKPFQCSGLISCFAETIRFENTMGLFKGLSPSLLKAVTVNALIFTIYEQTCSLLTGKL